jgi:tRNA dimethylallyltransferase
VADPDETFSAGRWAAEAREAIEEIGRRGRLPSCAAEAASMSRRCSRDFRPARPRTPGGALVSRRGGRGSRRRRRFLEINDRVSAEKIPPTNLRYVLRAIEIVIETGAPASARTRPGGGLSERWR